METKMSKFFESVTSFFNSGDHLPWCDRDIILDCEREVAEAAKGDSDERKSESILRLSWALVHSRQREDMQRGIAMLEALFSNSNSPLQKREKLYLLAVAYYRSGDYPRSRLLLDQCLEGCSGDLLDFVSNCDKEANYVLGTDGVIGIGITASAVGLIAGVIAAALNRR